MIDAKSEQNWAHKMSAGVSAAGQISAPIRAPQDRINRVPPPGDSIAPSHSETRNRLRPTRGA